MQCSNLDNTGRDPGVRPMEIFTEKQDHLYNTTDRCSIQFVCSLQLGAALKMQLSFQLAFVIEISVPNPAKVSCNY